MILPLLALLGSSFLWAQDIELMLAGKRIFIPKLGSKNALTAHPRFSGFIEQNFNKPGGVHGPNCYNTALITSGVMGVNQKRYVSPEEFEEVLRHNFTRVSHADYKDIIVFDAKSSRGHAAFYLGDNLVFHKKSYATHYHYRITEIEKVGMVEENEWRPGPVDDSSLQMDWPQLGSLPLEYYRLVSKRRIPKNSKIASLLTKIETLLEADLNNWAIARKWGMTGEYLLEDILQFARSEKMDKYTIGLLLSLKDQVYIMLEEVNFKRARSVSRVLEEICIPEQNEQLFDLIRDFGKILNKDSKRVEEVISQLRNQDLSRCSLRPLNLLNKI